MKIRRFNLQHLRNNEHFQFMTRVRDLVREMNPETLRIKPQYEAFLAIYNDEDTVLQKILKSALTKQIDEADAARDETFRGMAESVLSYTKHFTPKVREAAERVQVVLDAYGNVAKKSVDEETSAIYNLCQELTAHHAADVDYLDLTGWIAELDKRNRAFETLMRGRFDETAGRTDLVMREVRLRLDAAYLAIADRVDALELIDGDTEGAPWAAFIGELNAIIERTELIVAQRKGRAAAEKAKEEEEAAALAGVDVETWRAMQAAALAAEVAARRMAAGSATAAVVEQARADAVEVVEAAKQ